MFEPHRLQQFKSIVLSLSLLVDSDLFLVFVVGFGLTLDDGSPFVEVASLISGVVPHLLVVKIIDLLVLLF